MLPNRYANIGICIASARLAPHAGKNTEFPVRTIQAWLGHKNLETTTIYLGVTDVEKLRPQIDRAFGH